MKYWPLIVPILLLGCATPKSPRDSAGSPFEERSRYFLESHFKFRPFEGVRLGWHQYDGQFQFWDPKSLRAEEARLRRFEQAFRPTSGLSPSQRMDREILLSAITNGLLDFELREFHRNPMRYAGAFDIVIYFSRDFAPLPERIRDAAAILRQAPRFFAQARSNLDPALPRPFVETAILVAEGSAQFLEHEAMTEAMRSGNPAAIAEFSAAQKTASVELRGFAQWLKSEKLPRANDQFAIGSRAYARMLSSEQIELSPDQILELGMRELLAEQARFDAAARLIAPAQEPVEVYRDIKKDHPTEESLIPDTRKNLEAIREFVVQRQLVTIPSDVRARVEETPPPQRATSFASMDTPGPFETRATEAYYYVTPTEPDWTARQKEEWLTAFNNYTTDIVTIHEAYPGHYVQFLALNASGASTVAKAFTSYAFVEGWAHYAEQLLIERGFPNLESRPSEAQLQAAAKYQLAQSAEALLRLCRLVCSIRLHCQGMTVDEATRFFMDQAHYEQQPARQEAVRGTYDPGYCFYTLGKLQILKLRRDWQTQEGASFSLQRFHDGFLSHGAPPVPVVRRLMLKNPRQWDHLL